MSESADARLIRIVQLTHKGLGEGEGGEYVPYTRPGDLVRAVRQGKEWRLLDIAEVAPGRHPPACPHFGSCGGCLLQHVPPVDLAAWAVSQVETALAQHGLQDVPIETIIRVPPKSRRRAELHARLTKTGVAIGFLERASHWVVDMEACEVLTPALFRLIPPLRAALAPFLPRHGMAGIHMLASDTGIDLSLGLPNRMLDMDLRQALAAMAEPLDLARFSVNGEMVLQRRAPVVRLAGVAVTPPPEAFLQAVPEAESALQDFVTAALGSARHVADLFSGCGTFTFAAAKAASVDAFEDDDGLVEALTQGARKAQGLKPVRAFRRDLFRRPLLAPELKSYDAIILDPPRAGARAQAEAMGASGLSKAIMISCNPATFARDAKALVDAGFKITHLQPIDQFLWSPHVELAALFER